MLYEHTVTRPWGPDTEYQRYQEALDQVELADKVGIDYVWIVEHHFLEEHAHSSAPEVFLGACSQRTKRIRMGHGIVALPIPYNHPVRVAERISTLDLVSNGRVEFGTGETSSDVELGGFNISRDEKNAMWRESLEVITRMLVENRSSDMRASIFRFRYGTSYRNRVKSRILLYGSHAPGSNR
jgi:alkanesulfonate monooxygenase SsuD/methylene tetrahydromethanopterin reductase-like flavin-dependent oxidoreductase (luciferase family)